MNFLVRSDEELALTKAVCPSSDCWTLNEANSTCEIIMSSDCFQLDCSFDRERSGKVLSICENKVLDHII